MAAPKPALIAIVRMLALSDTFTSRMVSMLQGAPSNLGSPEPRRLKEGIGASPPTTLLYSTKDV